jgi:hypothetical protein
VFVQDPLEPQDPLELQDLLLELQDPFFGHHRALLSGSKDRFRHSYARIQQSNIPRTNQANQKAKQQANKNKQTKHKIWSSRTRCCCWRSSRARCCWSSRTRCWRFRARC